jgi:SAM-dependent methyltransferase
MVRADGRRLPFRDRTFDAVLIVHLLHLVDDWIRVVHEIGRVSSRLVMAVISTPWGSPVRQDYLRFREEMGYPLRRLNNAETDLSLLVPPSGRRHAVDHIPTRNAETAMSTLERGDYAISWDLPKDLHSKIIERLRSKYGQNDYSRKYVYEVATWTPEHLPDFKNHQEHSHCVNLDTRACPSSDSPSLARGTTAATTDRDSEPRSGS